MAALKIILFFLVVGAVFIAVVNYSGWALLRILSYTVFAVVFSATAYYLYKNMFTDDE